MTVTLTETQRRALLALIERVEITGADAPMVVGILNALLRATSAQTGGEFVAHQAVAVLDTEG